MIEYFLSGGKTVTERAVVHMLECEVSGHKTSML